MSAERRAILSALGAELVLTPGEEGMAGAVRAAQELMARYDVFMPQQFANPKVHEETTAQEIRRDTGGKVDIFVTGIGTGGTITGVGRFLKARRPDTYIVGVVPAASPVLPGRVPSGDPLCESSNPGGGKAAGIGWEDPSGGAPGHRGEVSLHRPLRRWPHDPGDQGGHPRHVGTRSGGPPSPGGAPLLSGDACDLGPSVEPLAVTAGAAAFG